MSNIYTYIQGHRYSLKPLCLGGVAAIYKAIPINSEKPCLTLKLLKRQLIGTNAHTRFKEEYRTLKKTKIEGVPKVIAKGKLAKRPYITYAYISGVSTLNLLKHSSNIGGIEAEKASLFLYQLLIILRNLQTTPQKIVHGDISPENIIVCSDKIYLIDFGNAQYVENNGKISAPRWIGKPSYLSPEQAQGINWDYKSDIYQAGIIYYELLTGKRFNSGKNSRESRTIAANPPPINLESVSEKIHSFISKLLSINPNDRISDINNCIKETENIINSYS